MGTLRSGTGSLRGKVQLTPLALLVMRASAVVFIVFGIGKFANHASETASFQAYGLPAPGVFTVLIGVIEIVGGVMLLLGIAPRIAAIVLAGDMVGAIVLSGLLHGETVSLTLAPALLIAMIVVFTRPQADATPKARGAPRQ